MPGQLKVASSCEHEDKPEQRKTHSVAPAQLTARVVPWQLDVWSHSTMHRSFGAHTIVSHMYCCAALSYTQLGCAYVPGGGGIDGPGGGGAGGFGGVGGGGGEKASSETVNESCSQLEPPVHSV